MLMIGRPFVRQIPSCVSVVMEPHNSLNARGNLPDEWPVCSIVFDSFHKYLLFYNNNHRALPWLKVTSVSHILADFQPVPQSCTSSTLLRLRLKIVSSYATLSLTFIFKQALNEYIRITSANHLMI